VWRKPSASQVTGVPTPYPQWTAAQQQELQNVWSSILNGTYQPLSFAPSVGLNLKNSGELFATELSPTVAWQYYVAYVAECLAVESQQMVPWSLRDYQAQDLAWMLDSQSLFHYSSTLDQYGVISQHPILQNLGASQPGDPVRTAEMLRALHLVGRDQHETIEGMLDWCRANMAHYFGSATPANLTAHWQYPGWPPIDRVLNGTTHPTWGFAHWTAGCWGTVGFLRNTLRTVNIPVSLEPRDGHALPHFHMPRTSSGNPDLYLSHGDDPYNSLWRATPVVPISVLPIDDATFQSWFGPNAPVPPGGTNVGRQTVELAIQYLSNPLLEFDCADIAAGRTPDQSWVVDPNHGALSLYYTVAELQAMNLWPRMDAKINAFGGCANVP
jgi:hypothetical protein